LPRKRLILLEKIMAPNACAQKGKKRQDIRQDFKDPCYPDYPTGITDRDVKRVRKSSFPGPLPGRFGADVFLAFLNSS